MRLLALFQEKETRDELGIGAIRDSFADQLFPGTSTIQTRIRYMLFIPWIYQALERQRVASPLFAARADQAERALVAPLLQSGDQAGVFGRTAGNALKRLPSSVYWAGLGQWGIRLLDLSQDEYHRRVDWIYRRMEEQQRLEKETRTRGDDVDKPLLGAQMWHTRLPQPPSDFPSHANFVLTSEEAEFLLDRLQQQHAGSLLAFLARHCKPTQESFPWRHPDRASFSPEHQLLLEHGRLFSEVMHGAALLYNVLLAELRGWQERMEVHRAAFQSWATSLDLAAVQAWSLAQFWELTLGHGHVITPRTRGFVERWVGLVVRNPEGLLASEEAHTLIRQRERELKQAHSRFANPRALDQWGGASGLGRLVYRWPTAQVFLEDLYAGLQRGAAAC